MKYDPERHHRRSIRLLRYDYTSAGAYFVTLVAYERACLFGEVADVGGTPQVVLSEYGRIAGEERFRTALCRPNVVLYDDEFVVMPNHVHGIIWIVNIQEVGAQRRCAPTLYDHTPSLYVAPGSLGAHCAGLQIGCHPPYQRPVWKSWRAGLAAQLLRAYYPQ